MTIETLAQTPQRRRLHNVMREAWRIGKHYWFSDEKWSGLALLVLVVALNLATVGLDVWLSEVDVRIMLSNGSATAA